MAGSATTKRCGSCSRRLERCLAEGLVGGEGFAIDASVIKADANRQRGVQGSEASWDRESPLTRPVREYLAALDAAEEQRKSPKNVSLTDPAAQWTAAPGGPAFYAYSTNYLIDTKAGVIVDVEATPAYRTDEVNATKIMVDRVEERFEIRPTHLIGDTAYGTAERKDGSLGRSDFRWEAEADEYRCPQDKPLRSTGKPTAGYAPSPARMPARRLFFVAARGRLGKSRNTWEITMVP